MEDPIGPVPPSLPSQNVAVEEPATTRPKRHPIDSVLIALMWLGIIGVVGFVGFWGIILLLMRCYNPDHHVC
jgi:hypothetical protein